MSLDQQVQALQEEVEELQVCWLSRLELTPRG